jgi:hypothetical protein
MVFGYRHFFYINSGNGIWIQAFLLHKFHNGGEMCGLSYIMYADEGSSLKNHESINCVNYTDSSVDVLLSIA